jgi:hypothetical protein
MLSSSSTYCLLNISWRSRWRKYNDAQNSSLDSDIISSKIAVFYGLLIDPLLFRCGLRSSGRYSLSHTNRHSNNTLTSLKASNSSEGPRVSRSVVYFAAWWCSTQYDTSHPRSLQGRNLWFIGHPPCSLDMSPRDYELFSKIKEPLQGKGPRMLLRSQWDILIKHILSANYRVCLRWGKAQEDVFGDYMNVCNRNRTLMKTGYHCFVTA